MKPATLALHSTWESPGLLDGSKAYLQAVIDNYSRRILAWRLGAKLEPAATAVLLVKASAARKHSEENEMPQSVMVDGGVENINHAVNELCDKGLLRVILAQTDLHFSNSMIEAFWRALKHQWLFLNNLDSISTLRKLVEVYVEEYNSSLPHSAFKGQTPDEIYFSEKTANKKLRFEPRENYPTQSPCASPQVPVRSRRSVRPRRSVRGSPGVKLKVTVSFLDSGKQLPIIKISEHKKAA